MRTTVDIDDDLFRDVKRLVQREKSTVRAILNRALRRSLGSRQTDPKSRPYRLPTFSMGAVRIPGQNLDKALALADRLEDEETARKLEMRK